MDQSLKKILLLLSFLVLQCAYAQQAVILKLNKYKVGNLSDTLQENSGLDFFGGNLFTFNDGGNSSELFQLDSKTGKILKKFYTNLPNKDWEALTSDGENFYIGDFGNNAGTRKDLKIYKLPVDSAVTALSSNNALQAPKSLSYYYPEQKDFIPKNLNHNFDTEAMVFINGKIHLFTKEWQSKSTTHYTLDPGRSERQAALKIETFKTGFMVTDAAYYNQKLYLIGYSKKTEVFLQVFKTTPDKGLSFTQPSAKYYLGSTLTLSQIEGIAVTEDGIYISGERFQHPLGYRSQKLFHIPHAKLKE